MTDSRPIIWPTAPIATERLVLRQSGPQDRAMTIELNASPEVTAYLGGPQPREELERKVPEVPGQRPGSFVAELDGAAIGTISLDPHDERPGHIRPDIGNTELAYLFLPRAWGQGYAAEACAAALAWFAGELPGEAVVLRTQTANEASMRLAARLGFTEVERFQDYGAEQWFGVWTPAQRPGTPGPFTPGS